MRVVISLLSDLTDDCAPELFWELECHARLVLAMVSLVGG